MRGTYEFLDVNKRLVIAALVAVLGILLLQRYINSASTECLGIADAKETTIAFDTAVRVKRIFVLPGQLVKKGQPLVEVEPAELNLKLLEVQTELEALQSELEVRRSLLGAFGARGNPDTNSPLAQQVAGLQRQVDELKRQQGLAVRYAEEDGVVATVAYRALEQVPPFMPIVTLTSNSPALVYGFIHEKRVAEFRLGDQVVVETVSTPARVTTGTVVSLGNRIAPFPDRFQTGSSQRPTYFGREVIISLPAQNDVLVGEHVRVHVERRSPFSDFGFQAFAANAETDAGEAATAGFEVIAQGLNLEASGLVFLPENNSLLIVSDDDSQATGSPFWRLNLNDPLNPLPLRMSGIPGVDDLESIARDGDYFYALSSLSGRKKDQGARNLILRFKLENDLVVVDRALDMRTPVLEALKRLPILRPLTPELDKLEVEAFALEQTDAYLALKQPRLPDGSSIIVKVPGLTPQIESGRIGGLEADVIATVKLDDRSCKKPARITDMLKSGGGLLILGNCKKSEKTGQLWWLADSGPLQPQATLLTHFRNGRPEGLSRGGKEPGLFYVSSDNGGKHGSDLLKLKLSEFR